MNVNLRSGKKCLMVGDDIGMMYRSIGLGRTYIKEVDGDEKTLRFYQEIYNEKNELVEVHQKLRRNK